MAKVTRERLEALMLVAIERKVAKLPPVEVPDFTVRHPSGDEETMVLVLSDVHFGHKTPTTTSRIIANRLQRLGERVVKVAEIHRQAFPIRNLIVFALGDLCQGDQIGRFVSLNELENTVMVQVYDWAVPKLSDFFLGLQKHFEKIDIFAVRGNHGAVRKDAGTDTNWDTIIYKTVAQRLSNQPRIRWHIEEQTFYQIVKIYKWGFLIQHGDNIRSFLNIPWYGQIRMTNRMRGAVPGLFHYVVYAHFHTSAIYNWNDLEIICNGCFVTDDQWVLKKMGMSSDCTQMVFGVHSRRGLSFRYRLQLD